MKRKLIEVALPLEAINDACAKEKARKVGKPQNIHHWWARRPITAARAVLFAQLVDDPSSHPDRFPTEEDQRVERERLHGIIERLVQWESMGDAALLKDAHEEILTSTDRNPPAILDPFAGGGTIPLEAQRLGLEVHASDLNPVAVLINKALVEIPPRFRNRAPVFAGLAPTRNHWQGVEGLVADVQAYGRWMRDEAERRIGDLYPKAALPDGKAVDVIAWIWARTVTCPNPACGVEMPLVRSWQLSKKKGKEAYVVPSVVSDIGARGGRRITYSVQDGATVDAADAPTGTVGRTRATCLACASGVELKHVRAEGQAGRLGVHLIAIVAEGVRSRHYLSPDSKHVQAAAILRPDSAPSASLPPQAPSFSVQAYGMTEWSDLFTNRQLVALTTFSDLVKEARAKVFQDSADSGYADAIATYLGLAVSRLADWSGSLCRWESSAEVSQQVFGQQSVQMVWDFAESRTIGMKATGTFLAALKTVLRALSQLDGRVPAVVRQADAGSREYEGLAVSTDPPYYSNVGYSDLSDYFYVWLRRMLGSVYPDLLGTILVPKREELVANQYRHDTGKSGANRFFELGFRSVFEKVRRESDARFPATVYYAYKQNDVQEGGTYNSGWETLLEGMIQAGWQISSTWPLRTESATRMVAQNTNSLASSIVISLRPRPNDAPQIDRRGFIAALEADLPDALRTLQQGRIAPVDLPQAAIGPGMAVFSRYSGVLEPDGSKMTVRSALARINEILDQVLSEQEGDFDATTRFAIAWFRQHGYQLGAFGDADSLARARNTSVETMRRDEILTSTAGRVKLLDPLEVPAGYDVLADPHTSSWEALHHLIGTLESEGLAAAGSFLARALSRSDGAGDADLLKELAHLLYRVCETNGWTKEAISFNQVVTSWPDILDTAGGADMLAADQTTIDFDTDDEES